MEPGYPSPPTSVTLMSTGHLLWAIAGLLGAGALFKFLNRSSTARTSLQKRDFLLTPEERQFFTALVQSVGDDYVIFAHVRVDDLITTRAVSGRDKALLALTDDHVPFVLCRRSDLSIACAIQIIQHRIPGRTTPGDSAENPLKTACQAAGLPLVRLEAGPFYDHVDIRQTIAEAVRREPLFITTTETRREPTISGLERLEL